MKRIAILVERDRAYGRGVCEGIAAAAPREDDWVLEFISAATLNQSAGLNGFSGVIARVADLRMARRLAASGLPVVDVFCTREYPALGFGSVDGDQAAIGKMAAEHFLSLRFSSFAYCGYEGHAYSDIRRDAFAGLLAGRGFGCSVFKTPRQALATFTATVTRQEHVGLGADAKALAIWLRGLPEKTAVFCCQDTRAWQVVAICREEGIPVPDRLAVLGVDNDPLVCSFTAPTLSSIDNAAHRVGETAVAVLSRMMRSASVRRDPPRIRVKPGGLYQRSSTEIYALNPKWVSDALVFITRNVSKNLTASDVTAFTRHSYTTVENAFKSLLGSTIQREIARSRIEEAKRLLSRTVLPVETVARRSGFMSPQYFCRTFKAAVGVTAEEFRRRSSKS
ncbi:MAG: DNA-binding transcriptional regulator [Kiritimatiellae bacterium]|nr:DNA-binding transcriptional regulator [Kiritimatiellia bacterium]